MYLYILYPLQFVHFHQDSRGADRGGPEPVGALSAQRGSCAVPHEDGFQEGGQGARHHGRLQGRRPQDGVQGRRQRHEQVSRCANQAT